MNVALRTPAVRYRLEAWASGGSSELADVQWAAAALDSVSRIAKTDPDFAAEELLDNPFYVFGGAVLEGLFCRDEFPKIIGWLGDKYGPGKEGSQVDVWLTQCWFVGSLLMDLGEASSMSAFVDFHGLCNELLRSEESADSAGP